MAGGVIVVRREGGWGCDHSEGGGGGRVTGGVTVVRGRVAGGVIGKSLLWWCSVCVVIAFSSGDFSRVV